jgi:uncharacterized Fe-S cluster protein YjdI
MGCDFFIYLEMSRNISLTIVNGTKLIFKRKPYIAQDEHTVATLKRKRLQIQRDDNEEVFRKRKPEIVYDDNDEVSKRRNSL